MISSFKPKIGSQVEVRVNGVSYQGELRGMSETEVYLKTKLKTWVIPYQNIQSLRAVSSGAGGLRSSLAMPATPDIPESENET